MTETDLSSLVPIAIALCLSLFTRNVIIGLFCGVFSGVIMINGSEPLNAMSFMVKDHLVPQLTDSYKAGVIVLLMFIGGFVSLVENSGGGSSFAGAINRWVKKPIQAQFAAWFAGIVIFFSDLGTPLIVGPVFQPLMDKLAISRQKLAFIIDSTASPVAILIPFIGWGVYIMSLINIEYKALGITESEFSVFVNAIPFQFYAWLAVFMVPILAVLKFDFGPMAKTSTNIEKDSTVEVKKIFNHPNAKPILVWLPLLIMALVLCFLLVPLGFPFKQVSGNDFRAGLSTAYFTAAAMIIALMSIYKVRTVLNSINIYLKGMSGMTSVAITLILAWALSDVGKALGAADYIASVVETSLSPWLFPIVSFILAAIISFATGSSWGTFAIMLPLVIPTAAYIDAEMYVCIGAVLSGGLFGDHSSPISETTILSSSGAGCTPLEHFRTQLPYAIFNGAISLLAFTFAGITGWTWIVLVAIALQIFGLMALKRFLHTR